MSASAMLLHRMLIKPESRGWQAPATSCGDPGPELPKGTSAYPTGGQIVKGAVPGHKGADVVVHPTVK